MPQLDLELLAKQVQENLDLDPRYWDQDEGAFDFYGERVFYQRHADWFIVSCGKLMLEIPRI